MMNIQQHIILYSLVPQTAACRNCLTAVCLSGIYFKIMHITLHTCAVWSMFPSWRVLYGTCANNRGKEAINGHTQQQRQWQQLPNFNAPSRLIKLSGGNIYPGIHLGEISWATYSSTQKQMIKMPLRYNQCTQFCCSTTQKYIYFNIKPSALWQLAKMKKAHIITFRGTQVSCIFRSENTTGP